MRRRQLAILALIAVALALLWMWKRPVEQRGRSERAMDAAPARPAPKRGRRPRGPPAAPASELGGGRAIPLTRAHSTLDPGAERGAFAGTVIDWGTGKPVGGAELAFEGALGLETTESDSEGRFRFTPGDLGRYRLASVTRDGYLPFAPELGASPIEVVPTAGVVVDGLRVYIRPAIPYRGLVVDGDGRPVAGASVRVRGAATGEQQLAPIRSLYKSDGEGRFEFTAPDGAVLVASDGAGRTGEAAVDRAVQISHELTLRLGQAGHAGATISGHVVDADGAPLAGASVSAWSSARGRGPRDFEAASTTDGDGAFTLEVGAEGRYRIAAQARDRAVANTEANSGAKDVELRLDGGLRVRGRVVDPSGHPVPGFHVAIFQRHSATQRTLLTTTSSFSGDGSFEVRGLPAGELEVEAMAYGLARSRPVIATAAIDPAPITVQLPAGATLVGTVVDKDSKKGLANAKVTVESNLGGGSGARPLSSTAITDDSGAFELPGLGPGRTSVVVAAYAHHGRIVGGLDAVSGARIGPMTIELEAVKEGESPTTELAGIGAAIGGHERGVSIEKVFPGGGAADADLRAGDIIIAVDGETVAALGFEGSLQKIRGPVGTTVALDIERGTDSMTKEVTRKKLRF